MKDINNLCTSCWQEPEKLVHLLFYCNQVQTLITTIRNNISPLYIYDSTSLNNPQRFLLGIDYTKCDNKTFLLNINIARFVWVAKHDGRALTLNNFKFFFNSFIRIQKFAGVLRALADVDTEAMWLP